MFCNLLVLLLSADLFSYEYDSYIKLQVWIYVLQQSDLAQFYRPMINISEVPTLNNSVGKQEGKVLVRCIYNWRLAWPEITHVKMYTELDHDLGSKHICLLNHML